VIPLLSRAISERFSNGFIPQQGAIQVSDYSYSTSSVSTYISIYICLLARFTHAAKLSATTD